MNRKLLQKNNTYYQKLLKKEAKTFDIQIQERIKHGYKGYERQSAKKVEEI